MVDTLIGGRYRLRQRIGAGGMSEVWEAVDLELDRTVAVKLLAADADPARFEREAQAAAALSHANICALYDFGLADGRPFMVLEYLPGGSLDDRLAPGRPLPDGDARRIAAEIAAGLAHAHVRGVVHRDLKPANILFDTEGRAKIADFGIARLGGKAGLTEVGTVLGTAAYLSPEQVAGRPATPASDVYAFGVILFRMITGRLPFESSDALELAAMHRDLPPPPVTELRPDAPVLLESVAAAALTKSPADRPRDGNALVAELGRPPDAALETTAATQVIPPPPRRRKGRLLVALAVAAIAAAGVGLALAVTIGSGPATVPSTSSLLSTTTPATSAPVAPPGTAEAPTASEAASETHPPASTGPSTTNVVPTTPVTTSTPTTRPTTTAPATTAPPTTMPGTTSTAPITTALTTTAAGTTTETAPAATAPTTTTTPAPG